MKIIHRKFNCIKDVMMYDDFLSMNKSTTVNPLIHVYQDYSDDQLIQSLNHTAMELAVKKNCIILMVGDVFDHDDDEDSHELRRIGQQFLNHEKIVFSRTRYSIIKMTDIVNIAEEHINSLSLGKKYKINTTSFTAEEYLQKLSNLHGIGLNSSDVYCDYENEKNDIITLKTNDITHINWIVDEITSSSSSMSSVVNYASLIYPNFVKDNIDLLISVPKSLSFIDNFHLRQIVHLNTYFGNTYVLNMEKRPDRWENMSKFLSQNHFYHFERFIGFDGNQEPYKSDWENYMTKPLTDDELRIKRKGIKFQGSWAILKSMKRMILDAKKKKYKSILVLQDDLLFHKNFLSEFYRYTNYVIQPNWKLMYLGASQHSWNKEIKYDDKKRYYHPNGTADGAFATAIHSSCYDELLKDIEKWCMPIDSGALCHIQRKYPNDCYVFTPNIIIADIRDSDLRKTRTFEGTGKSFGWDIKNYNFK